MALAALDGPRVPAAHRADQRPGRPDDVAGQLRAGLRGARRQRADPGAARRRRPRRPRRSGRRSTTCRFRYPPAAETSIASLEQHAPATDPDHDVLDGLTHRHHAGRDGRPRRRVRRRQVDAGLAGPPALRRDVRRRAHRRPRRPRPHARRRCGRRSASSPRTPTCSTSRSATTCATPSRTPPPTSWSSACRAARILDTVTALPDGFDTVVGDRGYRLSGGEKQRLAIARLLLKDPAVMILDEATSHLDNDNESQVQAALEHGPVRPHRARHRPPPVDDPATPTASPCSTTDASSSSAPTTSWSPSTGATPPSCGRRRGHRPRTSASITDAVRRDSTAPCRSPTCASSTCRRSSPGPTAPATSPTSGPT